MRPPTLLEALLYPEKYREELPTNQIVADPKIDINGVARYKTQLQAGKSLRPIVVVKHPHTSLYAVIDGHHRFFAQLESGQPTIACAVIQDLTGLLYELSKEGWFQPPPSVTKYLRIPILEFQNTVRQFILNFQQNPTKLQQIMQNWLKKQRESRDPN
jgi:hypothetical protein